VHKHGDDEENIGIDYLTMTGIGDAQWDAFNLWMWAHVKNITDWKHFVENRPTEDSQAVKWEDNAWTYLAGVILDDAVGFHIEEKRRTDDRLTRIMNAVWADVHTNTKRELDEAWDKREEPIDRTQKLVRANTWQNEAVLEGLRPTRHVHFKAGASESDMRAYPLNGKRSVLDGDVWARLVPDGPTFYVLDPAALRPATIDDEYVLVAGADVKSFDLLTRVSNFVPVVDEGGNLQWQRLINNNPRGWILLKKSSIEDL
jgi:hypothetical protein